MASGGVPAHCFLIAMNTALITLIASAQPQVYRSGSDELALLHFRFRPRGIFVDSFYYLVSTPGLSGADSFYTLHHARCGQTCPMIYDIPRW
jgi:hypothetical protein